MKIRMLIILCFIGLSISSCRSLITDNLSISDIEKYSNDVNVNYYLRSNYGYNSYILNINDDSVVEATKSVANYNDKYVEFNGYHTNKIKGISAIYDIDNNVILDKNSITEKYGYKDFGWHIKKYDSINNSLYVLVINNYGASSFIVCNINDKTFYEIIKVSDKYNGKFGIECKWYKNSIYILNDENELCEYNFDTRELKKLFIKPLCYSVSDDKIIYNDKEFIYEYDRELSTINELFRAKGHIEEIDINKDGTFLLTIETLFWHTEIFDDFLRWPTHNMNCLKIYELSTGKSKVLVNGNKEYYVASANFLE